VEDDRRGPGNRALSCQLWVAEKGKSIKENITTMMTKKQGDAVLYIFFPPKK
jgi:hypothetical protein